MLGLNFNQMGINNSMAHVLVMSVKVRRSEWLKSSYQKHLQSPYFYLPTWEKLAPPHTSLDMEQIF
jgi:hypothetical protein